MNNGRGILVSSLPSKRIRLRRAAKQLGVSPQSLATKSWRQRLGIPAYRVGRALVFDLAELDAWLAMRRERRGIA